MEQLKQALTAREQLMDQVIEGAATVRAIQAQMQPYANVDWVALAQSDPTGYPQHHANYQRLQNALYQAQGQLQQVGQKAKAVSDVAQTLDTQSLVKRMYDLVPAWKDQERFKKDRERIIGDIDPFPDQADVFDRDVVSDARATFDESAITGESAPVVRESGGDFGSVTGGTRVLSDWIVVRVTVNPGETFVDRGLTTYEPFLPGCRVFRLSSTMPRCSVSSTSPLWITSPSEEVFTIKMRIDG